MTRWTLYRNSERRKCKKVLLTGKTAATEIQSIHVDPRCQVQSKNDFESMVSVEIGPIFFSGGLFPPELLQIWRRPPSVSEFGVGSQTQHFATFFLPLPSAFGRNSPRSVNRGFFAALFDLI